MTISICFVAILVVLIVVNNNLVNKNKVSVADNVQNVASSPTPTVTPTPKPLTFAEMNSLYGPCVVLPTFMYHHIQSQSQAISKKQTSLTVHSDIFEEQMKYLFDKGYKAISLNELINFFDNGMPISKKSVLLTFDDAYADFYTDAFPVLQKFGFSAVVFVPTGLVNNPDYLTWDQIKQMNSNILFANHTWSHKSVVTKEEIMQKEILTADTQLSEQGLNLPKSFAYPYGPDSLTAENFLQKINYKIAFTTKPGNILCKQKRFDLPRIRIGNFKLSYYGF